MEHNRFTWETAFKLHVILKSFSKHWPKTTPTCRTGSRKKKLFNLCFSQTFRSRFLLLRSAIGCLINKCVQNLISKCIRFPRPYLNFQGCSCDSSRYDNEILNRTPTQTRGTNKWAKKPPKPCNNNNKHTQKKGNHKSPSPKQNLLTSTHHQAGWPWAHTATGTNEGWISPVGAPHHI